ncbi:hypothetical protein RJ640_016055 [Escallonia rubra]|uniref:protein-serine/threonine phosphatase n=1 Tax=Escallonia rubra TaxID=112253 RepID=A0AA88R6Y8_9ASTE|nr:hypothetical protein RJ640_016055 [Escallonia rubra]
MQTNNEIPASLHSSETCNGTSPPVSCSLKRKRPPKIEIPCVLREIPTDTKLTSRHSQPQQDALCSNGSGVAVFAVKGKKMFMEDTHKIVSFSQSNKGFFGVYDGHGGSKAAEFVAENLHKNMFQKLENRLENIAKQEAIREAYMKTDEEFLKLGVSSGACCVTALVEGKELFISNVGDCRAVICRGGWAEALTKDHRAAEVDERTRIEKNGGYVELHRGAWRVHGVLSVSRSIGDAHLKDWVLAEPDTRILALTPDMEYLVLASDGLWEEVGNQEAIDIVKRSCLAGKKPGHKGESETGKVNDDEFGCISTSPSARLRRVLLVKHKKRMGQSPPGYRKEGDGGKENEDDFGSENECPPPSKVRRISMVNQMKIMAQPPEQEHSSCKKSPASGGLVAACKELANLAVSRGSFDDVTVMVIDLNHFRG